MSLQLRRAEHADRDLLFGWANDDAVRANAFHTEKIPYEKHVVWFDKMMADASVHQYILCDGGTPVGQIRLNVEGSEAYVDYSIAADQRPASFTAVRMASLTPSMPSAGFNIKIRLIFSLPNPLGATVILI